MGAMGQLTLRRKTKDEMLAEIKDEQAHYDQLKVALVELSNGAVSASISTAGGSQSYTRANIEDLRALLRVSATRLNRLIRKWQGQRNVGKPSRTYYLWD